jgi:pilus assembly protein CpaE
LTTVLDRTGEFCAAQRAEGKKNKGRMVAVFSSKGGTGITFAATNLAAVMDGPTVLVDLNLQAGDADSFLGVEPRFTIADLVKHRARLDAALLASFVTPYSDNLGLLAAPPEAEEAEDIKPEHVFELLHFLRGRYAFVVLDLQHTFDPVTVTALDQADDVLLVMTLDIPGIRSTRRALKLFERIGYPRQKVRVVVNRWSKQIDVELQKVEHHLGERIVGLVPNDYRKVIDSINLGQPLVRAEPGSKIAAEFRRIAVLLGRRDEPPAEQPRGKLLKSVFGRQPGTATALELRTTLDRA